MLTRVVVAMLLAGTLVAAGCGGGNRTASSYVDREPLPPDTLTTRMNELGQYGGRFVVGATSSPKTFNSHHVQRDVLHRRQQSAVRRTRGHRLRHPGGHPAPRQVLVVLADGRTVTFQLRRGARFSDGHPITSEDVKFCFDVVLDEELHPSMQDALMMSVGGKTVPFTYSAPDSYTFVVTAPANDALFLPHIGNVRIVPKHVLEPAFREKRFAASYTTATPPESLVTSGPWRVKSYLENQQTVLERNPHWYGVDAKGRRLPYLDEVVFRVAKDQDVAAQMFHAGELDGLDNVKPEDYQKYEADQQKRNYTLHDVGASFFTNFMWFNLNRYRKAEKGHQVGDPRVEAHKYAWFSNRDFRRAVSKAVDREAIIRGPFYGYATKEWAIMTSGNARWYDSTITAPDFDPEGAKALLDKLGLTDRNGDGVREDAAGRPVSFTLMFNSDNKLRTAFATLLQDDLARVGDQADPHRHGLQHRDQQDTQRVGVRRVPAGAEQCGAGRPGHGCELLEVHRSHALLGRQATRRPSDTPTEARIDALFQRHVSTIDLAERKALYREMAQLLNDECFLIWLPTALMKLPVSSRFGNVVPSPMPHRILWNSDRIFQKHAPGAR